MHENNSSENQNEMPINEESSENNFLVDEISQAIDAFESIKPCLNKEKCSTYL